MSHIMRVLQYASFSITLLNACSCGWLPSPSQPASKVAEDHLLPTQGFLPPGPNSTDFPNDGVDLGSGWNSLADSKVNAVCISFAQGKVTGQETSLNLVDVVDTHDLMQALNISADLQVKAMFGSASAKTDYARSVEVKDDNAYFTAHVISLNGATYTAPIAQASGGARIQILEQYLNLAHTNYPEFLRQCGDSFVSAIHGGAELDARLQFDVHDVTTKSQLASSLNGSVFGSTFSASATSKMDEYNTSQALHILYHQTGGSGSPVPTDKAGLLDAVQNLAKTARDAPKPFSITLQRYDTLPGWSLGMQEAHQKNLENIARQYWRYNTIYHLIEEIKTHPESFVLNRGVTLDQLKTLQDTAKQHINSISARGKDCLMSASSICDLNAADMKPDYEYLLQLPAHTGFQLDNERNDTIKQISALGAKVDYYARTGHDGNLSDMVLSAANFTPTKAQWLLAQQNLQQIDARYPEALKAEIVSEWIEYTSASRCAKDLNDPGCILNEKIKDYARQIHTQ